MTATQSTRTIILLALLTSRAQAQAIRIGVAPVSGRTGTSNLKLKPLLTLATLTVTASPSFVSFNLQPKGVSSASSGVSIQTTLSGVTLLGSMMLYASFATSTAALTESGGGVIPSSAVWGLCSTGTPTTFTQFLQVGPTPASLLLWNSGALLALGGTRTDTLQLKIDLSSLPQTPAGTYTGSMTLQAQAF